MEQLGSHGTDIRKFWCLGIFSDIRREEVALKSAYSNGTLHEDKYTFIIIIRSLLLRMKHVSEKPKDAIYVQ